MFLYESVVVLNTVLSAAALARDSGLSEMQSSDLTSIMMVRYIVAVIYNYGLSLLRNFTGNE
jgi:hypothetical protein